MAEQDKRYCTYVGMFPEGFIADDGTDLSGVIFYVGSATMKGESTPRFSTHESAARRGEMSKRYDTIRQIWAKGMKVTWKITVETESLGHARTIEREAIKKAANPYLTNICHNPSSPYEKEIQKAMDEIIRKGWKAFELRHELNKREQG